MHSEAFDKAIRFAAVAHQGQLRKGTDVPYIVHPFAVASILRQQQCPEAVVIAGLLHDTIEDTDVTLALIRDQFGDGIAGLVDACTEPEKSLPWEQRKKAMIERAVSADPQVKWIMCADKYHNLSTMSREFQTTGENLWNRFSRGYDQQKWYMHAMTKALQCNLPEKYHKPMFVHLHKLVNRFFN